MGTKDRGSRLIRDVGVRLRSLRLAEGLTVTRLAERAGVDRAWLSRLECGHGGEYGPSINSLDRVVVVLGRDLGDLFPRRRGSP